eukprot:SAG31_NODE_644_length_13275_cov_39.464633_11_plen_204_part_00
MVRRISIRDTPPRAAHRVHRAIYYHAARARAPRAAGSGDARVHRRSYAGHRAQIYGGRRPRSPDRPIRARRTLIFLRTRCASRDGRGAFAPVREWPRGCSTAADVLRPNGLASAIVSTTVAWPTWDQMPSLWDDAMPMSDEARGDKYQLHSTTWGNLHVHGMFKLLQVIPAVTLGMHGLHQLRMSWALVVLCSAATTLWSHKE